MDVRKTIVIEEELRADHGVLVRPIRRVIVAAILRNPFSGRFVQELAELTEAGDELGAMLAGVGAERLGGGDRVQSFGKSALVGLGGELEHAAAILHPKFGHSVRRVIGGGKAIIPSSKKVGGAGTSIDVPLHYRHAAYVRSHFDSVEFRVSDAPRDDEVIAILALTDGGRPNPRVGGLAPDDVVGEDGLR